MIDRDPPALSLAIAIPVLNERELLSVVLREIAATLDGRSYTVCIVDDGSTDGTIGLIEEAMSRDRRIHLIRRVKQGRGSQRGSASRAALEWLVANTAHSVFVDLDADGAQPPSELLRHGYLVAVLGYDVAIASRYVYGAAVVGRPPARRFISAVYGLLARLLMRRNIRDCSHSYRFYTRRAAELILAFPLRYASPIYLFELLAIWLANDLRIIEAPTRYVERAHGRSKVKPIDLVAGLLGMLEVAWRFHRGSYRRPLLYAPEPTRT
jgi:dolichol-phosphate mannosyltransferase